MIMSGTVKYLCSILPFLTINYSSSILRLTRKDNNNCVTLPEKFLKYLSLKQYSDADIDPHKNTLLTNMRVFTSYQPPPPPTSYSRCQNRFVRVVGWLCLTSRRQRGHLETASPFTVHCEGREAR